MTSPYYWQTFGGVLRSEWVKLRTLRSTWWVVGSTVLVIAGMALASSLSLVNDPDPVAAADYFSPTMAVTSGVGFAQLVVIVLGALAITGEYATGMIRSSFAATPARTPVLVAKVVVVGALVLTTTALGLAIGWAASWPVLDGAGLRLEAVGSTWQAMLGVPVYLVLVALTSLGVGALLRHTAGAIFAMVAVVLVLPSVLSLVDSAWVGAIVDHMPVSAGGAFMAETVLSTPGAGPSAWAGFVTMVVWAVVPLVAAGVVLRRRDA
ncbi:ABC-2 type transport system permease protein [Sediminihabitans luteus]|uniref:ABC-2 type transport system permease protein n=1 Tax=Sediminihabitans luteus TaxID=1138585 RepID=A0A2M9CYZ4_9CELL|nr:ABC-2 type transport system permease protein [Sediminihabitans luteus]GIJ00408.1 ABC transporter permease [Sediminihabitans luteus]